MSKEQIVISRAEYESLLAANSRLAQAVKSLGELLLRIGEDVVRRLKIVPTKVILVTTINSVVCLYLL